MKKRKSHKRVCAKFYRSRGGSEPVRDWLLGLAKKDRVAIGTDIQTTEYGWPIGMPTCKPMGNGLHEVRTDLSNNRIARVLFFIHNEHMILLQGFIKKTQSTPKQDLDLAKKRKKEVENE
ncbi:type II toxin-antitoxin system RelE/ParE family toxin [Paraglaciecola sp. MB-3u-78]|jgi:phage-related protein|uniref:type II toxin-antitoxin system RelE/ParE family toxin n=1 Tax=Paraglaciecola sp. MB-3u-78 TaxID=2058332 RepID=UPI000C34F89E|nr:type II toxin-antitoxin system RelE/ParE family toxin [Paraglaciecola sp. MB-3u-78]PKG96168.1 type II toxin-antitoxin system RelE/ParE family toxin [Paraglaciecola sp. MB-3u-78]